MVKFNITIELESNTEVIQFRNWIEQYVEVIDSMIIPDTKELYEKDPVFKSLVKKYKEAKKVKNDYINDNIKQND